MKAVFCYICCCFLAVTSCHEDPYIGLWMAMLGIKQLLVRWQGCKGLSIYWNNRSEETIRSCDGYREVVLGVTKQVCLRNCSLQLLTITSGVCLHRNNPSYYWGLPCHGCKNALAGHSQSTYDYKTDNMESLIIARSYNDNSVSNVIIYP